MAERKKRIGRPTKPGKAGQRVPLGLRVTAEFKRKIDAGALKSGRSQSQEVEFLVAQGLLKEEAYGGRELHGLLMLMVGAAEIIQARNGKSASDDWNTGLAVDHAWKRQIRGWLPRPPDEWIAEVEWRSSAMSYAPERPKEPIRGGLLAPRASEEEWEAYRKRLQKYQRDLDTFLIEYDEHQVAFRKIQDEFNNAIGIGEEAFELRSNPRREAVTETGNPS